MQKITVSPDTGLEELYYKVGSSRMEAKYEKQDGTYTFTLKNPIVITKDQVGTKNRVELHSKFYGMKEEICYLGDFAFVPQITILPLDSTEIPNADSYYPTFKVKVYPDVGSFTGNITASYKPDTSSSANTVNLSSFGAKFTKVASESTSEYGIYKMSVTAALNKNDLGVGSSSCNVVETYTFNHSAFNNSISITQTTYYAAVKIYGVQWNTGNVSKLIRTDSAAGFSDPVPYVAGATTYGSPFDDLMPWAGMTKVNDSQAGVLVAIPKYYYKWTAVDGTLKLQITNEPVEGFYTSPAHANRGDGKGERDVVYVGRYHCDSGYKSTSGAMPLKNVLRSTSRTNIHKRGTTIWQFDLATLLTIQMLYLVEFANSDSQATIGVGCGSSREFLNVGYTDSMPYHTGTTQASRDVNGLGVQYRWIEGLWDNGYTWVDGCYYKYVDMNGKGALRTRLHVILNPASFSDTSNGTMIDMYLKKYDGTSHKIGVAEALGLQWTYSASSDNPNKVYIPDECNFWEWMDGYDNPSLPCILSGGLGNSSGPSYCTYFGLFFTSHFSADKLGGYNGCRLMKLP